MMNLFGLERLSGIFVYTNGTCRAYHAARDDVGVVYEENDTFPLYQITEIFSSIL